MMGGTAEMRPHNGLQYFEVKGWHKDAGTQIAVTSAADIVTARRIISSQVSALTERCQQLDRNLKKSGTFDAEIEKSKTRPSFDLTITKGKAPSPATWQPLQENSPPRQEKAPRDQSVVDWLTTNSITGSTYLTCGTASQTPLCAQLKQRDFKIVGVLSGEGKRQPVESGHPDRSRPQAGSLAQWFADTPTTARADIAGYILDATATTTDLNLIRHRVLPGQYVCTERYSKVAEGFASDWDGRIIEWPQHVMFLDPGPRYLDPLFIPNDRLHETNWPKISVVTVSYNQAPYLEDCLRSVLDQGYPNLEYIVIDAASSDGSQEILQRYAPQLSRLIIEPDEGQSHGLNKGLDVATGDILTWINSDDMLAPGALRRAALAFLDNQCDLIVGGCERITENSAEVTSLHHPALPYGRAVPLGFFEHFMWTNSWERGDYFYQPEVLFTADIWHRSGGYLKQHLYWAMDWELWIRMGLAGAIITHIPDTIGRSREHEAQKTTSEQRYLHQLKNILLEHDDALSQLQQSSGDLPKGEIPDWINFDPIHGPAHVPLSLYQRIWMLRDPQRLHIAIQHRLPEPVKTQIKRLWRLRHPENLRAAINHRIPPRLRDYLREKRKSLRYDLSGVSFINRVRLKEWTRSRELLVKAEHDAQEARAIRAKLETEIAQLRLRCTELSEQCLELNDRIAKSPDEEQSTAEVISESIANFATKLLFDRTADLQSRQTIAAYLAHGNTVEDALRTVAIQCYSEQSKVTFTANRRLLARPVAMPELSATEHQRGEFTIIDVGAEPLDFEAHVYAALPKYRPSLIIGFDPTDQDAPKVETSENDEALRCEIRTLPYFIGDGHPATCNLARMQPTSSLLEPNLTLARRFSLLAEALEIVESRAVETRRLDDVIAEQNISDRWIDFVKIDVQGATLPVLKGARETLSRTLICHLEAEFTEIYLGEALFSDIDRYMRELDFVLMDIATLGRQRYNAFDVTEDRFFHAGRLLWADCVYVRHLDDPEKLTDAELLKLAEIAHVVYGKYDVAAFALQTVSNRAESTVYDDYTAIWN